MKVNPVYATTAEANVNGAAFGEPDARTRSRRPTPTASQLDRRGQPYTPPPLCSTDWMPYTQSFRDGARMARAADDRAKIAENPFADLADQFWTRAGPQVLGRRAMLTITDTVSAAKYGIQTARPQPGRRQRDDRDVHRPRLVEASPRASRA